MKKITLLFILSIVFLIFQDEINAQNTYYSDPNNSTDFNLPSNWKDANGQSPSQLSNANNFVLKHALTLSNNATVGSLSIEDGGILNMSANTLTISKAGVTKNATLDVLSEGALNISGTAKILVNGNFNVSGGALNQSSGEIIIDGNDNNNVASSVASGTSLLHIEDAMGVIHQTGGKITIIDPPANLGQLAVNIENNQPSGGGPFGTAQPPLEMATLIIGENTSTTSISNGFIINFVGTTFSNLIIDGGTTSGREVVPTVSSCISIREKLSITSGSVFNAITNCPVATHNLENNGILTTNDLVISASPQQTSMITGTGAYRNDVNNPTAFFEKIRFHGAKGKIDFGSNTLNLNKTVNNITFNYDGHVKEVLEFSSAKVNTNGQLFILGTSIQQSGQLQGVPGGFVSGSIFGRWYSATSIGTALNSLTNPSLIGEGSYPFITENDLSRSFYMFRTPPMSGGLMTLSYSQGTNNLVSLSPSIAVQKPMVTGTLFFRSEATWEITTSSGFSGNSFNYSIDGQGIQMMNNPGGTPIIIRNQIDAPGQPNKKPNNSQREQFNAQSYDISSTDVNGIFNLGIICNASNTNAQLKLDAKILLEKTDLATKTMSPYLATNVANFPLTDPYTTPIFHTSSNLNRFKEDGYQCNNSFPIIKSTTSAVINAKNIVDWVFIRLTSEDAGSFTTAALLKDDGTIVDMNGNSPVTISNLAPSSNYQVTILHRNHLAIKTTNAYLYHPFFSPVITTDFTIAQHPPIKVNDCLKNIGNGIYTMLGGNANPDGSVEALDTILWEQQNGKFDDYDNNADYNLDGSVDALDTIIWELNNGKYEDID